MSLDLRLVILDKTTEATFRVTGVIQSSTVLAFESNTYSVFRQLHKLGAEEQPPLVITPRRFTERKLKVSDLSEQDERLITKDFYWNEPFTFIFADEFEKIQVGKNPFHMAIKVYVAALPPKTRILLFWQ